MCKEHFDFLRYLSDTSSLVLPLHIDLFSSVKQVTRFGPEIGTACRQGQQSYVQPSLDRLRSLCSASAKLTTFSSKTKFKNALSLTCTLAYTLKTHKNRYNFVYYNLIVDILVLITCLTNLYVLLLQMTSLRVTCPLCCIQTLTRTFMMPLTTGLLMKLTISLNSKISTTHILMVSCIHFKFLCAVIFFLTNTFLFLYIHVNLSFQYLKHKLSAYILLYFMIKKIRHLTYVNEHRILNGNKVFFIQIYGYFQ